MDSLVTLFRPTPRGEALLRSLDLRQMKGEPGYFGSYGFDGWAGIGEAKPVPAIHELMHSYWGGFPVIGRPELSWARQEGKDVSAAMTSYHRDVLSFMAQPPDDYEILRQRFRNLPELSGQNTEPLFHSLEADLPHTAGGDLGLVPPILRKYWGYFLSTGPFYTWEQATGWLQSLPHEERRIAGKFLGFEHLDLRQYGSLPAYALPPGFLEEARETLEKEERQRLTDLVDQFDLLLGDAQLEENFQFWRGYLRDKVSLHRDHPDHLPSLNRDRANQIAEALESLNLLEGGPGERAETLLQQIEARPFVVNFLPAVENRTLVELFAAGPNLPDAPTLQATASFVERLQRFATRAEGILQDSRMSPSQGAEALVAFLNEVGPEREQDLRLFFDLLHDADPAEAHRLMIAVDAETIRDLMTRVPVNLRTLLRPERLLEKLQITTQDTETELTQGIRLLIEEPSGNYRIDEPYLALLFEVMAARAWESPREALRIISNTPFPLEDWILRHPEAASAALSSDLEAAAALVEGSDLVVSPPPRIIYRLISADPELAARLVMMLDSAGRGDLVAESLAYFAYDKVRSEKYPQLPISLEENGEFLVALVEMNGENWLESRITVAVSLYRKRVEWDEVAPDFIVRYRETLEASVGTLRGGDREMLQRVVQEAFG